MIRRMSATLVFLILAGCTADHCQSESAQARSAMGPPERVVKVFLYPDGHFESDRTSIAKDQVSRFADEVGDRSVKILAVGFNGQKVSFAQAADLRDSLKRAGVKNVSIALEGE